MDDGDVNCSLWSSDLGPVIVASDYWKLILNHNQNLLGKCFLVLGRHMEVITQITPAEWMDLHKQVTLATQALILAFKPDHFNYAFLQNQDRHVHLHIIPRYAEQRLFADSTFDDPDYPAHYSVPAPARRLKKDKLILLAEHLQQSFLNSW